MPSVPTDRADLSDDADRCRPFPATTRAGSRDTGPPQTKQVTATTLPNQPGAQAQPRATTRQRGPTARLEQAREEETAARKFRNHKRGMLFLLKGPPSTSPFCTWVNEPREPEGLPPDWTPDESTLKPLPDDPPF